MDVYESLKTHFADDDRVTINQGKGAQGMKVMVKGKPKMVVMFSKGDLLLQMPADLIAKLIADGKGELYDPGTGKAMKDRLLVPATKKRSWKKLVELTIESSPSL
jgi:hypothetical protein